MTHSIGDLWQIYEYQSNMVTVQQNMISMIEKRWHHNSFLCMVAKMSRIFLMKQLPEQTEINYLALLWSKYVLVAIIGSGDGWLLDSTKLSFVLGLSLLT